MLRSSRNFCVWTRRRDSPAKRGRESYLCLRFLVLLFLICLLGGKAVASTRTDVPSAPAASGGLGPSFAIADFDGDQQLDIATVEGSQLGSASNSEYWIELQLTAAARQAIHVVAPFGGLAIEARDVNGDHAIDLVVTTAWLRAPVAVFLNDGHGRFSRAEPSEFPGAFGDSQRNWGSSSNQTAEAVGIPPQSRSGICSDAAGHPDVRGPTDSIPAFHSAFIRDFLLTAQAGRAPPSKDLYL